ncbi:MAG: carbohydrate binding domain-containing protein [Oscillospiraceae bacterium]|nr:carbohydrate binding domain-containing protein [Oscillospiraceae bacterium]
MNGDGAVTIADAVLLQKWLICEPDAVLPAWKNADMDENGTLNAADLTWLKRVLLWADWRFYNQGLDNSFYMLGSDAFRAEIREIGAEHWYAQVYKTGLHLEAGKTYRLTFTAAADAARKMDACIQQDFGDYKMYLYKVYTLTAEPQTITVEVTMTEDCENGKFLFDLGHETGSYYFYDISFEAL